MGQGALIIRYTDERGVKHEPEIYTDYLRANATTSANTITQSPSQRGQTVTNLERMRMGYAAIDPVTGQSFQLHHIGQTVDSPLAILTPFEHTGGGNNAILHDVNIEAGHGVHSLLPDAEWTAQKIEFWKMFAEWVAAYHPPFSRSPFSRGEGTYAPPLTISGSSSFRHGSICSVMKQNAEMSLYLP